MPVRLMQPEFLPTNRDDDDDNTEEDNIINTTETKKNSILDCDEGYHSL